MNGISKMFLSLAVFSFQSLFAQNDLRVHVSFDGHESEATATFAVISLDSLYLFEEHIFFMQPGFSADTVFCVEPWQIEECKTISFSDKKAIIFSSECSKDGCVKIEIWIDSMVVVSEDSSSIVRFVKF